MPPNGNLEPLILEIWEQLLGRTDIGVDDNFFELGGDSLLATTMMLEVEAVTRQPVSPSSLRGVWTVRKLAHALVRDVAPDREVITCAKEGNGAPFFFCHGDYRDRGIYAFRLVDLIAADAPILLLNHWRDFKQPVEGSLEDVARLYVPHLVAAQPAGSFRIGGYCIGGLLAWEIARQLKAAGREVELVVAVDSPSLNGRASLRALKKALDAISSVSPRSVRGKIERNGMWAAWIAVRNGLAIWTVFTKFVRLASTKWFAGDVRPPRWDEYRRLANYIPGKLDTELHYFICADNAARADFQPSNWRRIANSTHSKIVPGDHHSCVTKFAKVVAAELQQIISTHDSCHK